MFLCSFHNLVYLKGFEEVLYLHHIRNEIQGHKRRKTCTNLDLPTSAGTTQVGEDSSVPSKCLNSIHMVYPDKRKIG